MFQIRPYQEEQLKAIERNYLNGTRRQVISSATGTGKSVVSAQIPQRMHKHLSGQTLLVVHRDELLDQNIDKLQKANPTLKVSKEKAEHVADTESDIIVASVQTLGRKGSKRIERFNWDNIDKVISDECHHSVADSYVRIYERAGVLANDTHKLHVGFSATPQRADKQGLSRVFQSVVYDYGIRKAIEDGWLVDVKGIKVNTPVSLDCLKTLGGDFEQGELAKTLNTPQRNQLIVKAWLDHAKDRQTIVFCVDIQHTIDVASMFRAYGIDAEAVWGDDPLRADKLERYKNQEYPVIANCGILTEGYDNPSTSCIIPARCTKSSVLYSQMIGRGTRLYDGKTDVLILDLVDVSSKHSLTTLPTLLGLQSALDLQGRSLVRSVQLLEDKQREYSHIDFSTLADISQIETFIEQVDVFNIHYPEEVEENSEFKWQHAFDGGYVLNLPNKQQLTITEDLLGKWNVHGELGGKRYRGIRDSVVEAFQCADNLVTNIAPDALKIVKRTGEAWHSHPASPEQLRFLAKLLKGKPLKNGLTKGEASAIIDKLKTQKRYK